MAVLSACSVHVTYVNVAACMAADGPPALAAAHPSAAGALPCHRRCMSQGCRRSEGRRMSPGQAHVHRHAEVMDQQHAEVMAKVRAQHRRSDYDQPPVSAMALAPVCRHAHTMSHSHQLAMSLWMLSCTRARLQAARTEAAAHHTSMTCVRSALLLHVGLQCYLQRYFPKRD